MSQKTLHTGIAVVVVLLVVGVFFILGLPFDNSLFGGVSAQQASVGQTQLVVQDVLEGSGQPAAAGDTLVVHYTGRLEDGTVFDTSAGGEPYTFVLGAGEVIAGWDQGLVGVQTGTKRLLLVPPTLAYGSVDYGPIPGDSTLIFEVDVVEVKHAPQTR